MAERRMFAKTIIDSDAFLDMPLSTQALYFHLSMRADDEGFINNPRKIQRMIGASDDDLRVLMAKNFIIPFDSGIVVIKHWKIHNYIQSDRFKPTMYQEEREQLEVKGNKAYTLSSNELCIQDVSKVDTQVRLGKVRLGKDKEIMSGKPDPAPYSEVVSYLNERAGTAYKATSKKTRQLIHARFNEGFTLQDFQAVIDSKCREWLGDKKMAQYLRPETLFGTKFEGYLQTASKADPADEGWVPSGGDCPW